MAAIQRVPGRKIAQYPIERWSERFCVHGCLPCNGISIGFSTRFTRHEISDENNRQSQPSSTPSSPNLAYRTISRAAPVANRVNEVTFYDRFQVSAVFSLPTENPSFAPPRRGHATITRSFLSDVRRSLIQGDQNYGNYRPTVFRLITAPSLEFEFRNRGRPWPLHY